MHDHLECQTIVEALQRNSVVFADAVAFRLEDQSITFAEFATLVRQWQFMLSSHGVAAGDRVAVLSKDSIHSYACFFAIATLGAVCVPLNWRLSNNELRKILDDSSACLMMHDTSCQDKAGQAFDGELLLLATSTISAIPSNASSLPSPLLRGEGLGVRSVESSSSTTQITSETPVVQIYTSGTTGEPKGVVLTHRTFFKLLNHMRSIGDPWMNLQPNDRLLLSLPMFHIGGLWWAIQGFVAGACGMLLESFVGWKALQMIEQYRITKVAMVPAMMQFVLAEPDLRTVELRSVSGVLYGGSPITSQLLYRIREVFACDFFQIYGLTETGNMAVCLRPQDHDDLNLWQAAGKALPGVELKVCDSDGDDLPAKAVGEVWIKSPSVMKGYWNNPCATDEVLHDGWIKTGDAGYVNSEGYLFICDRIKDMIIYAGENVFPAEIESVLATHEAIAESSVIGVPDDRCGELVKAFLVLKPNATRPKTKDLLAFCRGKLADFKIPKSFEIIDALPRNPAGKVLKHVLRKPYWEKLQRQVN